MMASAHDVARYILVARGRMTAMKLQKLVYYSQAWSLVWDEARLFDERIEAWSNGPVVRELYNIHRGEFMLDRWPSGDIEKLLPDQRETIDAVLRYYGSKTSQELSDMTHAEQPWLEARDGLAPTERGDREITCGTMHAYYSGLPVES